MPGIQYYRQTMPTYICQELFDQCIKANVGNQDGQKGCTNNISALCAKIDPPSAAVSDPGSASSSASSSAGPSATASSPSSAATGNKVSSTSSRALAGPTAAPVGNGALVAAMGLVAYIL